MRTMVKELNQEKRLLNGTVLEQKRMLEKLKRKALKNPYNVETDTKSTQISNPVTLEMPLEDLKDSHIKLVQLI